MISFVLAWIARIISGATVKWTAPLEPNRQRVYFANHSSHLDFILIWSFLPPIIRAHTRPVAGSDYWGKDAFRRYISANVFNSILIERASAPSSVSHGRESVDAIATGMGADCSIIVFPEGTRSETGEVLPFKSGLFHLCALKPHLELVPIYLGNMNRILPKGELLPIPLIGRVIIGAPMRYEPGEDKTAFLARARDAVLALKDQ